LSPRAEAFLIGVDLRLRDGYSVLAVVRRPLPMIPSVHEQSREVTPEGLLRLEHERRKVQDVDCVRLADVTALPEGSVRPPAFETVVMEQVPTVDELDSSKPGFVPGNGRCVAGVGVEYGFCTPEAGIEGMEQPL
jgi:hypothetical protein